MFCLWTKTLAGQNNKTGGATQIAARKIFLTNVPRIFSVYGDKSGCDKAKCVCGKLIRMFYQKLPFEGAVVGGLQLSVGVLHEVSSSQSQLEEGRRGSVGRV